MELKPTRRSLTPADEDTTLQTSASSTATSPPVPSLAILREAPYANSMPEPDSEEPVQNSTSRQSSAPTTLYQSLTIRLSNKSTRVAASVFLGALTMAFVARVGQVITQDTAAGCDADLIAFMRDLNLESLAPEICSKGYTRLADLLHMSPEMLEDEIGIPCPAHRHRILYTSAEMLAEAQFSRQALVAASASAAHAWGPLKVLCVAIPLVATCGCFLVAAVALSLPEVRNKLLVLLAVGASELWYWLSHRRHTNQHGVPGSAPPQRSVPAGSDNTSGDGTAGPTGPAGSDSGVVHAASPSSRSSSRGRHRSGRSSRRPNNSSSVDADAPRTPDNSSARRHTPPVTVLNSGGRISSGGRAARRAGSAAAAAFAALSPRTRNRAEPPPASGNGELNLELGRGGSDRSIPAAGRTSGAIQGMLSGNAGSGKRVGDTGDLLELPGSRLPERSSSRQAADMEGVVERVPALPTLRGVRVGALAGTPEGTACGPVGEAAAVRALNSGLARQARHVFGGVPADRVGPAAVGGSTSSSSAESSGSTGIVAHRSGPLTRVAPEPAAPEPLSAVRPVTGLSTKVGEIDLALSVVSVDSVKTDGGSHDGATVSLSTWKNGVSLAADAGAGGGDSAIDDGSDVLYREGEGEGGSELTGSSGSLRQGKRWQSAVRRLQRGNTRMLQLLRSRAQE